MDSVTALDRAIDIAKEYARSEGTAPIEGVLERVYETLKKLGKDAGE